jgi:hypothetical protein
MAETLDVDCTGLPAAWTEIARRPAFAAAARRLAGNMLDLCAADRHLAAVFKDAGRYVAAMSAAYLHGAGGLTLPLLKQICAGSGLLSPGRAQAILEFLLHIDYLHEPDGDVGSGRYLPTARFLAAWARHLQAALDAGAVIEPGIAVVSGQLENPDVFEAFLAVQAARLHGLTRTMGDPFPGLNRAFLHPHAGSQILWMLVAQGDDVFPRTGEIRISLTDVSRRFEVTHVHVRRLLRQAQEQGMLTYAGHGRLSFEPLGASIVKRHFAFQLSEIVETGRAILARQGLHPVQRAVPGQPSRIASTRPG